MKVCHSGRCQCGKITYDISDKPLTIHACHCKECQKRSGSAFGISMPIAKDKIKIRGELNSFERVADSGFKLIQFFCSNCGNPIYSEVERRPNAIVLFPGTLDDTNWFRLERMIWTCSAQSWYEFPIDMEKLEKNVDYGS
jgi:hypothetical protein